MLFSERVTNVALVTQTVPTTKKIQKRGFPRPDRGHHVPALTVTSGGRGVGSEMACLVKSSRGRERHGIQYVDAMIPGTETWTLRVMKKFPDWTSNVIVLSRVVRFPLLAGGCRFGSGPGRSWGSLSVACGLLSRSSFISVGSKPGRGAKTGL